MSPGEWLGEIDWVGSLMGVGVGVVLPALWGLFFSLARLPVDTVFTFVLIEVCIGLAGFVSAWWAWPKGKSVLLNGLVTGLLCALVALMASVLVSPVAPQLIGLLVLFVGYALSAALGGILAGYLSSHFRQREGPRW